MHKRLPKDLFNLIWDFLDKVDRTGDENLRMTHAARASQYHWGEIGEPLQFERGEWQISRVYSVIGRSEPALLHAEKCLSICVENEIGDFDIAFAYEAMARAYVLVGDQATLEDYIAKSGKAEEKIEGQGNKDYFLGELKSIEN